MPKLVVHILIVHTYKVLEKSLHSYMTVVRKEKELYLDDYDLYL